MKNKVYIGDGVYASNDGWHVILEADNESGSARIYLDSSVCAMVQKYAEKVFNKNPYSHDSTPNGCSEDCKACEWERHI